MGVSAFLMSFFFDFYFDMNDDTMMRDIMSGVYSGTPDGHNMQTLYPLGALLALCYRICGSFPWYGIFLFLCQFGCFFLVGVRLCTLTDAFCAQKQARLGDGGGRNTARDGSGNSAGMGRRLAGKLLSLLMLVVFQWGIWLIHMVNVQYTITCGMLVGTAVFLFLTMPERVFFGEESKVLPVKAFLTGSLPALLLFLLAFQLRSEMAFLTLPFLGLAGIYCWWEDRPVFEKKNVQKYGGLLLFLLVGMGFSLGADSLAYGGEWKTFRQFFDDRTAIYDFYPEVLSGPPFDVDLEEQGISCGARILLANYNFGLDERIDAQMLSNVAAYAKEHVGVGRNWRAVFKEKLMLYCYRSFHGGDMPYNLLVISGYGINIIVIVILFRRDVRQLIAAVAQLFLVFMVRSALWMFILMRGRDPERITHPLYLVEFCLLAGLLLWQMRRNMGSASVSAASVPEMADAASLAPHVHGFTQMQYLLYAFAIALLFLSVREAWKVFPAVCADQERRLEINRDWEAINAYCRERLGIFYFEDVYSTVAFSGKLLECRDNAIANYDIAGGWMCKSPLYQEKLAAFGIENAADALAEGKADFIMSDEEISLRGLSWLEVPYAERGMEVQVEECDRIGKNYGVYQIVPISENGQHMREIKREW